MAQSVHAAFHFAHDHRDLVEPWLLKSNFLVIVSVPNEDALLDLIKEAATRGIARTAVREPDINDEATAVAFEPGAKARRLCAELPLALKNAIRCDGKPVPRVYTDEDAEVWSDA